MKWQPNPENKQINFGVDLLAAGQSFTVRIRRFANHFLTRFNATMPGGKTEIHVVKSTFPKADVRLNVLKLDSDGVRLLPWKVCCQNFST